MARKRCVIGPIFTEDLRHRNGRGELQAQLGDKAPLAVELGGLARPLGKSQDVFAGAECPNCPALTEELDRLAGDMGRVALQRRAYLRGLGFLSGHASILRSATSD